MGEMPRIGGQAVMEGVMMKGCGRMAMAVRTVQGKIALRRIASSPVNKVPFVRGVVNLVDTFQSGTKCIMDSVEMMGDVPEPPTRFENWLARKTGKNIMDVMMIMAAVVGIALAVGLFVILPNILANWLTHAIESSVFKNLIEGVLRLAIFLGYMGVICLMKDIRRFFAYHGAEHKTINCFEKGLPLTVENIQRQSMSNPRCGTSFMLIVMVVSILVFSFAGWTPNIFLRILIRLALLPVVASFSYEVLMLLAKKEWLICRLLRSPGMLMQRMTTRQPDDSMVEVALVAFAACLPDDLRAERLPQGYRLPDEPEPQPESAEGCDDACCGEACCAEDNETPCDETAGSDKP